MPRVGGREPFHVDPQPLLTLELDEAVLCMDYCPQNPRYVAVGTASGEIDLFDLLAVVVGWWDDG